jgi:Paramyxovirus RNA dependent RNA polymerase.
MVACFWSTWYLLNDKSYKNLGNDALVLVACLLIPSLVGGFPIIFLHNMWVRAESDLLSPFLQLTEFAIRAYPGVGTHMQQFCTSVIASPENRDLLMRDPYAIPTTRPRLPAATLRGYVIPSLRRIMKNEHFQLQFSKGVPGMLRHKRH